MLRRLPQGELPLDDDGGGGECVCDPRGAAPRPSNLFVFFVVFLLTADHYTAPLRPFRDIAPEPIFPWEVEDPDIFVDSTNNLTAWRWHVLGHRLVSNISSEVCAHAVAASPWGPWKVATAPAYTRAVGWVDGSGTITTHFLQGRERPRIIVDRGGTPVVRKTAPLN